MHVGVRLDSDEMGTGRIVTDVGADAGAKFKEDGREVGEEGRFPLGILGVHIAIECGEDPPIEATANGVIDQDGSVRR